MAQSPSSNDSVVKAKHGPVMMVLPTQRHGNRGRCQIKLTIDGALAGYVIRVRAPPQCRSLEPSLTNDKQPLSLNNMVLLVNDRSSINPVRPKKYFCSLVDY